MSLEVYYVLVYGLSLCSSQKELHNPKIDYTLPILFVVTLLVALQYYRRMTMMYSLLRYILN